MSASEVLFYRLSRGALEQALPKMLESCQARNWRAVVRLGGAERVETISDALWRWRDESFLAHGAAADGRAARQPIWLTAGDDVPNDPHVVFFADGVAPATSDFTRWPRLALIFDAGDAPAVEAARGWWRQARELGIKAVYWAQTETGGWRKEAESDASSA